LHGFEGVNIRRSFCKEKSFGFAVVAFCARSFFSLAKHEVNALAATTTFTVFF
jgi:hypothetical protein